MITGQAVLALGVMIAAGSVMTSIGVAQADAAKGALTTAAINATVAAQQTSVRSVGGDAEIIPIPEDKIVADGYGNKLVICAAEPQRRLHKPAFAVMSLGEDGEQQTTCEDALAKDWHGDDRGTTRPVSVLLPYLF